MATVTIIRDTATPELKAMIARAGRPLLAALGKTLEVELRQHFKLKGQIPNKRGWPKQHFWDRRIRNATALTSVTDTRATVTIADPAFATHFFGGTIRPKEKQALAIPLQAAAYGKQPSSRLIPGLFLLRTKKAAYLVAYGDAETGRHLLGQTKSGKARYSRTRATLHFYYILLKSVTIPKDPLALPRAETINRLLLERGGQFLIRKGLA